MSTDTLLYRAVEPMLHKIVNLIHRNYEDLLDKEELFAEACLLFMKAYRAYDWKQGPRLRKVLDNMTATGQYDKDKLTDVLPGFSNWVWLKVYQGLLDVRREIIKKKLPKEPLKDVPQQPSHFWQKLSEGLSEDARLMLGVCLENRQVRRTTSDHRKGALFSILRGMGWAWERITNTFLEMKEALV